MYKLSMFFGLVIAVSGCANTVSLPVTESTENKVPGWYVESHDSLTKSRGIKFWQRDAYYASVSSAVSPDRNMAERKAILHAKNRIADRVFSQFESEDRVEYRESGSLDQPEGVMRTQYEIKNKVSLTRMQGYEVTQRECYRQLDLNNWICFVEIQISKADLDKALPAQEVEQ